jgi:hypothetical protein
LLLLIIRMRMMISDFTGAMVFYFKLLKKVIGSLLMK